MKKTLALLVVLAALGALFSCATATVQGTPSTENQIVVSEQPAAEETPAAEPTTVEPAVEPATTEVSEEPVAEAATDESTNAAVAEESEPVLKVATEPPTETWTIVHAQIDYNGETVASSDNIPVEYQQLEYDVVTSGENDVKLVVSGHEVASGTYSLDGNRIAIRLTSLNQDDLKMVADYYGIDLGQIPPMDAYYFFVTDVSATHAVLKAYAFDRVLTLVANGA